MLNLLKGKYSAIMALAMIMPTIGQVHADYVGSNSNSYRCCEPVCCEQSTSDWIVSADLLYWRALQNGLECGCGPEVKHQWDLGYRIGFEYASSCNNWDLGVYWTHFNNNSKKNNGSCSDSYYDSCSYSYFDESYSYTCSDSSFDSEGNNSHFKLRYDAVDVLLGHKVSNDSCFSYTPYVGLRGTWIDEKLSAHFRGCDCSCGCDCLSTSFDDEPSFTDQSHKQKFWGVGPEIGIKGIYNLGCDFSLYGNFDVGFLYGRFDINVHDYEDIEDATDNGNCCVDRQIDACQAFTDIAIGIQWDYSFCNDKAVIFKLGVEHHRYFNQNQIGGYGDLCFDGATFSAGIKF